MFDALEAGIGLDVVLWLQNNRAGWMETLVLILDTLGGELGYIVILTIIFWTISKREGLRLIFALVAITIVTYALQDIIMRPRPVMRFPDLVTPVMHVEGFGLPSGHTSIALMIWGYIALWQKKNWMWVFAIFYIGLQGLGRMVAGVHYPHDIVAGVLVGLLTLALYYPLTARREQFWNQQTMTMQLSIAVAIPLIIAVVVILLPLNLPETEDYLTVLGLAIGAGTGAIIETRKVQFEHHPEIMQRLILFVIGIVILVAILLGLSQLFDLIAETGVIAYLLRLIRYSFVVFTAIALIPLLGIRLGLMQSQGQETT